MKNKTLSRRFRSKAAATVTAACLWALFAAPAQGALFMSINPANTPATAGSLGNFFDVLLTNTSPGAVNIAGFSYQLTVGTTDLVFTAASTTSPAYIFSGNSFADDFNTGDIRTSPNGQSLQASDLTSNAANISLSGMTAFSLGRVTFSILSGAPIGPIAVNIDTGPATSLSDAQGNPIALGPPIGGTVTVSAGGGGAVPEPSTAFLLLLGVPVVAILRKRR